MSLSPDPISSRASDRFDLAIQALLVALLAFMPAAFGAVDAWAEECVITFVAAMSLLFSLKLLICRQTRISWSWSYLPIVLFLGLIALQMTPIPDHLIRILSPHHTLELQRGLLQAFAPNSAANSKIAISFYPYETRHQFRLILAAAALFVIVTNVVTNLRQIKGLLAAIAIIATFIAAIDFLQILTGTDKVYWVVPMAHRDSGTFANHSHYGQFINLSVGAMISLALLFINDLNGRRNPKPSLKPLSLVRDWRVLRLLLVVAAIVLCLVTLCLSLTRGGMVAAVLAGTVTSVVVLRTSARGTFRGWLFAGACLGCLVVLMASGFDGVFDRVSTLGKIQKAEDFRPQVARDLRKANKLFPVFGTGLGTHPVVYPAFQSFPLRALAYDADDEYVQLAEEVGAVGLLLIGGFLSFLIAAYVRVIRFGGSSARCVAAGLGFGLLAILIQSASDFGQRIPAIACLTAVICAVLVNLWRLPERASRAKSAAASSPNQQTGWLKAVPVPRFANVPLWFARVGFPARCLAAIMVALLIPPLIARADAARLAESSWNVAVGYESQIRPNGWMGSNAQYAAMISAAAHAHACEPDNVRFAHWLNVYRWQSAARLISLHDTDPADQQFLKSTAARVIEELATASASCPIFAPNYSVAGQLDRLIFGRQDGSTLVEAACRLWPHDENCELAAVTVAAADRNWDNAAPRLRDCVDADPALYPQVLNVLLIQHDRPDLAEAVAGDNVGLLLGLDKELSRLGRHTDLCPLIRGQAADSIWKSADDRDTTPYQLFDAAMIYLDNRNPDAAVTLLGLAVDREPGIVDWRAKHARVLSELGRGEEAVQEARICLRLRPEMPEALEVIGSTSRHPRMTRDAGAIFNGVQHAQE